MEKDKFKFTCEQCGANFNNVYHLRFHQRKKHDAPKTAVLKSLKKCPLCESFCTDFKEHLFQRHDLGTETEDLDFPTYNEFLEYKDKIEKCTNSKFVKQRGSASYMTNTKLSLVCHRNGYYVTKGKGMRHLKTQGTNKINGFCPAAFNVTIENDGKCKVHFTKTHIGHQNDIGHLSLTPLERQCVAEKIASKIPFDAILDEVRDSITNSSLDRIHLLNKKDLYNIENSYNLCSSSVRHREDGTSVESWVIEMQETNGCVLYYKPQGICCAENPELKNEDFILIIMNDAQSEILKKYSSDCVCLDGTHGLNSYGFELITLLVIDDMRQGFPCSFLISIRSDPKVLEIFFSCIRKQVGKIRPKVFMSDMAEAFFNAWIQIMEEPQFRLFCSWHVDRAWRKNLPKIKIKDKQIAIYKALRTLLEERDQAAFTIKLQEFLSSNADPDTSDFLKYFQDNYTRNVTSWAYSYRVNAGLNTNMHIERMHKSIKYIYLHGKNVKRLDKAIHAIMKFVRDKLIDRLIVLHKGKITSKLKDIRARHKTSETLSIEMVMESDNGWEVPSLTGTNQIYFVKKMKDKCDCQLVCSYCQACLHTYSCSCLDSSIKWNMCKHIHLICKYQTLTVDKNLEQQSTVEDENLLILDCGNTEKNNEAETVLTELSRKRITSEDLELNDQKKKLKKTVNEILDSIANSTEFEAMKRLLDPLRPTLEAVRKSQKPINIKVGAVNTQKNIIAQRRLFKTKKQTKKSNNFKK